MKFKNKLMFSTKSKLKAHKKLHITLLAILTLICGISIYLTISYKNLIDDFKYNFNENKFTSANNVLITQGHYNPIKSLLLKKDLSDYFYYKVTEVSNMLSNNEITKTDALNIISEINRYDFTPTNMNSLIESLDYDDAYNYGVSLYDSGRYLEAYNVFSTVNHTSSLSNSSLDYLKNCKDNIKAEIFAKADELSKDNYYTKALDEINSAKNIIGNDEDVKEKIKTLQNNRTDFLIMQSNKNVSVPASSSIIKNLNPNNINTLSISSDSNYIVHVNITNQKTYIYSGSTDNWIIEKTFICSTGIEGEDTPEGIFMIQEKGDWFFSEKYNQGGKYWVQFLNDFLFHSLPLDYTQSTIVDYTLGTPASHGCIRLSESDAKWLYDTVPSGSKVIISK